MRAFPVDLGRGALEKPALLGGRVAFDLNKSLLDYPELDDPDGGPSFGWGDAKAIRNLGFELTLVDVITFRAGCIRDREGGIDNWGFKNGKLKKWNRGFGLNFNLGWFVDVRPIWIRASYSSVPQPPDLARVDYWAVSAGMDPFRR